MNEGRLNQRVRIEQIMETRASAGSQIENWTLVDELWADVEQLGSQEQLNLRAQESVATLRVWIRYRPDITSAMRLIWKGVIYHITEEPIDRTGLCQFLEIFITEHCDDDDGEDPGPGDGAADCDAGIVAMSMLQDENTLILGEFL